jgi:hypothetical protein
MRETSAFALSLGGKPRTQRSTSPTRSLFIEANSRWLTAWYEPGS